MPHLPHGHTAVSHHQEALNGDDIMPELFPLDIQEFKGYPCVEHGQKHGGDDDAGCHPTDGLPSAPLLHGAGIA